MQYVFIGRRSKFSFLSLFVSALIIIDLIACSLSFSHSRITSVSAHNQPKKNLSGYFIFTQERRPALKAQHPDKKLTALTTIMAKEWKEMDDATKKGFQARSDADKATYQVKLAEYQKTENYTKFQSKLSVWKRESNLTAEKNAAKKPKGMH